MKPIQVGILVAVAAVAGGLITKWSTSRHAAPLSGTVASAPATPAPSPAAAPVAQELPSPFVDEKPAQESPAPRKAHRPQRPKPVAVAQNQPPAVVPAPEPAPKTEPAAPEPTPALQPAPEPVAAPAPPPPPRQVTLTAGTLIPARTVEGLNSDRNQVGDGFTATLDQPLVVDGLVIAERGARLEGRVVQSERAGRVKGVSDLAIELTQLTTSDGQRVRIETESFVKHGQTSKKEDAAKIGGGAALGAIIGAIAGGGKGAAIGTAVGGAAGTGTVVGTRGKAVSIDPETRISFRLRNSVTITERRGNR